jgi:DNA-binding CsgD family transcriptional regulator
MVSSPKSSSSQTASIMNVLGGGCGADFPSKRLVTVLSAYQIAEGLAAEKRPIQRIGSPHMRLSKIITKIDLIKILEFIHQSLGSSDIESFHVLTKSLKLIIPHDNAIFGVVTLDGTRIDTIEGILINDYPMEWMELYLRKRFQLIDPITRFHFSNFKPQIWSETYRRYSALNSEFVSLAREHGLEEGLTYGLKDVRRKSASIFSFSGRSLKMADYHEKCLELIAPHLHQLLIRSVRKTSIQKEGISVPISPRKLEILQWIKSGKTNWEISTILNISERTVKFHVSNIMKKLVASSRSHAVAKALELEIITL